MLRTVLYANALSCFVFGVLFLVKGPAVADFLGNPPVVLLQLLGVGLLANTVLLVVVARQKFPKRNAVMTFAIGDAIWLIATIVMLVFGLFLTTAAGIWAAVAVAAFVGGCGALQYRHAPLT